MKAAVSKILLLLGLWLLTGCGGIGQKLDPVRIRSVELHGLSGADLTWEIGNSSGRRIRIRSAEIVLRYDGIPVGTATLIGECAIEKRSHELLSTRWRLRIGDPAAARLIEKRIEAGNCERISIDYTVCVGTGLGDKTFSATMVPFSVFLATFDRTIDAES